MKNWKLLAAAQNLEIPDPDLARIIPSLDALEAAFRPLVANIPPHIEPAAIFQCPSEDSK
jgi:hypothetical protein